MSAQKQIKTTTRFELSSEQIKKFLCDKISESIPPSFPGEKPENLEINIDFDVSSGGYLRGADVKIERVQIEEIKDVFKGLFL